MSSKNYNNQADNQTGLTPMFPLILFRRVHIGLPREQ